MDLFTGKDFRVFGIPAFADRMAAIRARIQPRLASIGEALAPRLSGLIDAPLHVHVAKHMRRTVNPPDDTWAAFGRDPRGYKKDAHFRVSVSGPCVRFLFEAGPEYFAKSEWVRGWNRLVPSIATELQSKGALGWFQDEHEDLPQKTLKTMTLTELKQLGKELTRGKKGQIVLGRSISAGDFLKLKPQEFVSMAMETFTPLAPLFEIHEQRVLVPRNR